MEVHHVELFNIKVAATRNKGKFVTAGYAVGPRRPQHSWRLYFTNCQVKSVIMGSHYGCVSNFVNFCVAEQQIRLGYSAIGYFFFKPIRVLCISIRKYLHLRTVVGIYL